MMDDPTPERNPTGAGERWSAVIFLLILLGLFAGEVIREYHPAKLTALFIVLFWIPLLVLHETGHAVVAALLGWRVHRIVIGMGPRLTRFRVAGIPGELRMVPVEGFVIPTPRNLRWPQLKSALIYFAGPGTELLLLALLATVLGFDTMLTRTDHIGLLAAQSFGVAVLASAVINLMPHYATMPGGQFAASDGLGIIRSFLRSDEDYARQIDWSAEEPWAEDPEKWKD